jgi:peptidoglycan/xylan/chitin deacetylase (PgdA/CDA1 family)
VLVGHPAAQAGDLVAASDGRVLRKGAGGPARASVNGRPARSDERVLPGDAVTTARGADLTEETVEEFRALPILTKIVGTGAILTLAEPGASGLERVVIGAISGDVVESETVRPSDPMVLQRVPASASKKIALTFDDGPWPVQTERVLDILRAEGVSATFFMVGLRVKAGPEIARRVAREGHAIGNHTYRHVDVSASSAEKVREEIARTNGLIITSTGAVPRWFRPPMGSVDDQAYTEAAQQGLGTVLWTVDPRDWERGQTAQAIETSVVGATHPGSVILLHDGGGDRSQTIAALPGIIKQLKARGYEFVLLDDLPVTPRSRW